MGRAVSHLPPTPTRLPAHGSVHPQGGGTHTRAEEAFPKRSPAGLEAVWCSEKEQKTARNRLPSGEKAGGGLESLLGHGRVLSCGTGAQPRGTPARRRGRPLHPWRAGAALQWRCGWKPGGGREWRSRETGGELT